VLPTCESICNVDDAERRQLNPENSGGLPLAQQLTLFPRDDDTPAARKNILTRYFHLREVSKAIHAGVLKLISTDALLSQARRLGLARGKTLLLEHEEEMFYVYDLAIYNAPPDRSRAIDRYAKSASFEAQSDERLMLEAMRRSRFAILAIDEAHGEAGLVATDIFRNSKVWLLDIGIERSMGAGDMIATRLLTPGPFSMTASVMVPFDTEMLEPIPMLLSQRVGNCKVSRVADDRRFAEAVYKVALAGGVMERVAYFDSPDDV